LDEDGAPKSLCATGSRGRSDVSGKGGTATNGGDLSAYSLVGSVGPYGRWQVGSNWELRAELYAHPQDYFTDDLFDSSLARSGWGITPRIVLRRPVTHGWWNPEIALTGDYTHTDGTEFQSKYGALEFGDRLIPDRLWVLDAGASMGIAAYDNRPGSPRTDPLGSLRFTATYLLTSAFTLTGDLAFIGDYSNIDTYAYTRFAASFAVNYFF
jgi:hypothetical protein